MEKLPCANFQPRHRIFRRGACVNCGALGHLRNACFRRPMTRMAAQFTNIQYDEDDANVVRQRAEAEQVNTAAEAEQVNAAAEPEQVYAAAEPEQVYAAAEPEQVNNAAEPSEEKLPCSHFQPRRRRFVGGSCVNCGAIGHKAKACFHRPMSRNMAQFTDVQYQADDHQFFLEREAAEDDIQYQTEDEDAADEVEAAEDQDHEQKAVAMGSKILFQDIFVVEKLDGKKSSDEYTPIQARSQNLDMFMHLDVKTEVYPMELGYKFTLAMAPEAANLDEFNWMGNIIVLEDIFVVDKRDGDGEKVLIVKARTGDLGMHMRLDVDTEAYPMAVGDKFSLAMALAPTA